jgi:leucyl aminopeptidase
MNLELENRRDSIRSVDLLAVVGWEGKRPRLPDGVRIASHVPESFRGEFRELRATDAVAGGARRVLLIGLGKPDALDLDRLRRLAALAAKEAERARAGSLGLWLDPDVEARLGRAEAVGQALAEGARMGSYVFQECKSKPKKTHLSRVVLWGGGAPFRRGGERGNVVAEANLFARRLQDMPANRMRPRDLVTRARSLASRKIRVRALDAAACRRLGMGAFLSVAKGSVEPPYLIHLVHRPSARPRGRIALVGKGLTFDAGGISLKPAAKMEEMKYDMSGGAAVLGVFHALRRIAVPFEVHGVIAATENLPDGRANKPGDVVEAMDGTTIEVQNTDAEGRLVLADALLYAQRKVRPEAIVDLATLTGAVITALGHELSGVLGSDAALIDELVRAGKECGELLWPLPLLDVHKDHMKSKVADLKNINAGQGAGSSAGAAFLSHFVDKVPWAHLDIAGSAWGADERDYQGGAGGTGVGVRLLLTWLLAKA